MGAESAGEETGGAGVGDQRCNVYGDVCAERGTSAERARYAREGLIPTPVSEVHRRPGFLARRNPGLRRTSVLTAANVAVDELDSVLAQSRQVHLAAPAAQVVECGDGHV